MIAFTSRDINTQDRQFNFVFASHDNAKHVTVVSVARVAFMGKSMRFADVMQAPQSEIDLRAFKMLKRAVGEQYFDYGRSSNINNVMYTPIMSLDDLDEIGTKFIDSGDNRSQRKHKRIAIEAIASAVRDLRATYFLSFVAAGRGAKKSAWRR